MQKLLNWISQYLAEVFLRLLGIVFVYKLGHSFYYKAELMNDMQFYTTRAENSIKGQFLQPMLSQGLI